MKYGKRARDREGGAKGIFGQSERYRKLEEGIDKVELGGRTVELGRGVKVEWGRGEKYVSYKLCNFSPLKQQQRSFSLRDK